MRARRLHNSPQPDIRVFGVGASPAVATVLDPISKLRIPLTPEYIPYLTANGLITPGYQDNQLVSISMSADLQPMYPDEFETISLPEPFPEPEPLLPEISQVIPPGATWRDAEQALRDMLEAARRSNQFAQEQLAQQQAFAEESRAIAERTRQEINAWAQHSRDEGERQRRELEYGRQAAQAEMASRDLANRTEQAGYAAQRAAAVSAQASRVLGDAAGASDQAGAKPKLIIYLPRYVTGEKPADSSKPTSQPQTGKPNPSQVLPGQVAPGSAGGKQPGQPGSGQPSSDPSNLASGDSIGQASQVGKPQSNVWLLLLLLAAAYFLDKQKGVKW